MHIYFIDYDDFKNNNSDIVNSVFIFLGVNDDFQPYLRKKHNTYTAPKNRIIRYVYSFVSFRKMLANILPKNLTKTIINLLFRSDKKPKLSEATRDFLKKHFESDVRELSELLNKDFTKWTR